MNIEDVLPAFRAGKKIYIETSMNGSGHVNHYIQLKDGKLWFQTPNKDIYFRIEEIILRDDWKIVEEKKCEMCLGHKKLSIYPWISQFQYVNAGPRIIDCPECK